VVIAVLVIAVLVIAVLVIAVLDDAIGRISMRFYLLARVSMLDLRNPARSEGERKLETA
jgi:hypothetical protein